MTALGTEPDVEMAPGLSNAYWFAIFNALSYQIVLGNPMVLYAKHLEASATVLGIIAGMMPLLVIFQIPAARQIARLGHRRFVLAGWSLRVMFIFLMALAPLTAPVLSPPSRVALMLFLLILLQPVAGHLQRGVAALDHRPGAAGSAWAIPRPRVGLQQRSQLRHPFAGRLGARTTSRRLAVCRHLRLQRPDRRRQSELPQAHA
jgi:hypothetical protein